jgi:hypothetical protein
MTAKPTDHRSVRQAAENKIQWKHKHCSLASCSGKIPSPSCQKPQNITIQDNKLLFVVVWLRSSLTLAYQSYKYCIYSCR